ncbi:MAG: hypothetical protein ACM3X3_10980 [Betaproteobacteria bacterium]
MKDGDTLGPVLVTNRGTSSVHVRASYGIGGHDRAGVPTCRAIADPATEAVEVVLDPAEFRLAPGESMPVYARVRVKSGFLGGAYPVVLFQASVPEGPSQSDIGTTSQVAVLMLLTSTPHNASVRLGPEPALTSLAVAGAGDGKSLMVTATCHNSGNVHASLSGSVLIRDREGRLTAQGALSSAICLPGCARALSGLVDATRLRNGTYVAEVRLAAAGRPAGSALIAFKAGEGASVASTTIDLQPGLAPSDRSEHGKAPRIARLTVPAISEGRGLPLEVALENLDGSLMEPLGYVEIRDYQMRRVGVMAIQHDGKPVPGGLTVIRLTWPDVLSPGYYTAKATLQWRGESTSLSTPFVVGGSISLGGER